MTVEELWWEVPVHVDTTEEKSEREREKAGERRREWLLVVEAVGMRAG